LIQALYFNVIQCIISNMAAAINFRLKKPGLDKKIKSLETTLDRDRSWIMNDAIETYVECHEWQIKRIKIGIAQADAKKFVTKSKISQLLAKKK
jgi:RHH-type transcriptional regulator, rel operon repressor / antitoxin RelB